MPQAGTYTCRGPISLQEAQEIFREKSSAGWESYIGYPNTAALLATLFGEKVRVSRDSTRLVGGDVMLSFRLPYRVFPNAKAKNEHGNRLSDYEIYVTIFQEK